MVATPSTTIFRFSFQAHHPKMPGSGNPSSGNDVLLWNTARGSARHHRNHRGSSIGNSNPALLPPKTFARFLEHAISKRYAVRIASNNTFAVVIVCQNWKSLNGLARMRRARMGLAEASSIVSQHGVILRFAYVASAFWRWARRGLCHREQQCSKHIKCGRQHGDLSAAKRRTGLRDHVMTKSAKMRHGT
jgi:hypothetical protein